MSSITSIAMHEEFIRHCYGFRINLQCIKNHRDKRDFQQVQLNAIIGFKKMMEIANNEANGNGQLRHDFECWLLWNYELNFEHCSLLMNEQLNFGPEQIGELMHEIPRKREDNKEKFVAALMEYEHVKGTLARRRVRQSQALYVFNFFTCILRKILAFDTTHMYEIQRGRLEEELKYIVKHIQELNFSQLANNLQTEWKAFEKAVQDIDKSLALQNDEINAALDKQMLAEKRTFLQQMAQKIGELYETIRIQLRQIRDNAFTLQQAFLNPICSPIESVKNIFHVFCHPLQTAKVAWEWVYENPGKTALLVIGTLGISLTIGAVAGIVGSAIYTGTSIFSVTAADFIFGGAAAGAVLTTTTLTAVGGKAARESALAASNAIESEMMLRKISLEQLNREEEEYRKHAREAMRVQRKKVEVESKQTSFELLYSDATATGNQFVPSQIENDSDRLANAAQDMQFAKEDISRELIQINQVERDINDYLHKTIELSLSLKKAINQNQNNTIKTEAKQLVSLLNEQDRFDDSKKILDALKKQDYNELKSIIDEFHLQYDLAGNEIS